MSQFLSGAVLLAHEGEPNPVRFGPSLNSHKELNLPPETYREFEWTGDDEADLKVRGVDSQESQALKEVILSRWENRTKLSAELRCKMTPQWAYEIAYSLDKGPRNDTRAAACRDAGWAYFYAHKIDNGPRDDTRTAACGKGWVAYLYARAVDKGPRDDTRAACGKGWWQTFTLTGWTWERNHEEL